MTGKYHEGTIDGLQVWDKYKIIGLHEPVGSYSGGSEGQSSSMPQELHVAEFRGPARQCTMAKVWPSLLRCLRPGTMRCQRLGYSAQELNNLLRRPRLSRIWQPLFPYRV